MTARLGPGLRGPEAEAALNAAGWTLGHFPQSFPYATIGGFAATRSAGQASSGYGRFDELVTSVTMQTPSGAISTLQTPHTAAGPALRELIIGSEGTLGVITDVTVRIRPLPAERRYEGWFAESFEAGIELARSLAQGDCLPDVFRLSDREETRISLAMSGIEGIKKTGLERYLSLRGRSDGCMVIVGWEGEREAVARRRELSVRAAAPRRRRAARPLGRQRLGARALRGALPARPADGRGRDGRDARDLAHLHADRRALRGRPHGARGGDGRPRPPRDRHVPRLPRLPRRRLALLHLPLRPRRQRPDRPVARRQDRTPAKRSSPPAARSPTITPSAPTTLPTWRRRSDRSGSRPCAPSRNAATRPGS